MKNILEDIIKECHPYTKEGKLADYIPELAKADRNDFGIYIVNVHGKDVYAGDYNKTFTMQSIVKPIILLLALMDNGMDTVREKVGLEATGKPFDSFNYSDLALVSDHINPMINTGAIALCTLIKGQSFEERFERLLDLTRKLASNPEITMDENVYLSEKLTGNKNRALAYMLKAYNLIHDDVEEVLDCYFRACSIKVTCGDLAKIAYILANHGTNPATGEYYFSKEYAQYVNAVLMICGMYDGSGEFAINVGLPAKSGVGGGIIAIAPKRSGIGIYSPALDNKGNSVAGIKALEALNKQMGLSIF